MTNYRRNLSPGGTFFFTVNLSQRRWRLLTQHVDQLRRAFRKVRHRHPFVVDAIVILPDHLHAIWTLPEGDADFPSRWRLIKSEFSRDCRVEREFPQAVLASRSVGSGNDAIGNILCAMKLILSVMSITFTTIRLSMVMSTKFRIGRIHPSTGSSSSAFTRRIGPEI